MNCRDGSILGDSIINWERYELISGLIGRVAIWALWAAGAASLLFLVLFPIACVISWTLVLGSRVGWWRLPDEREGVE